MDNFVEDILSVESGAHVDGLMEFEAGQDILRHSVGQIESSLQGSLTLRSL